MQVIYIIVNFSIRMSQRLSEFNSAVVLYFEGLDDRQKRRLAAFVVEQQFAFPPAPASGPMVSLEPRVRRFSPEAQSIVRYYDLCLGENFFHK